MHFVHINIDIPLLKIFDSRNKAKLTKVAYNWVSETKLKKIVLKSDTEINKP